MEQLMTVAIVRRLPGGAWARENRWSVLRFSLSRRSIGGATMSKSLSRCKTVSPATARVRGARSRRRQPARGGRSRPRVAPATASQQLASLMDAHAYHDLVGVISQYRC